MVLWFIVTAVQAQITAGSLEPSNRGALLDLKGNNSNGANSTKGLPLSRVKLTDPGNLFTMFNQGYDSAEKAKHTGLIVYNISTTSPFSPDLYVWTGSAWRRISH
jgi:hypothetical protein